MNTLGQDKKLKSRNAIKHLLAHGKKIKEGSLLMIYIQSEEATTRIAVSVQKRNTKLAVNRNRIKRLMREAYRLNQQLLPENVAYHLFFLYLGKDIESFDFFNTKIKKALVRLSNTELNHEQKT
jgi:ribonuclease P protein component